MSRIPSMTFARDGVLLSFRMRFGTAGIIPRLVFYGAAISLLLNPLFAQITNNGSGVPPDRAPSYVVRGNSLSGLQAIDRLAHGMAPQAAVSAPSTAASSQSPSEVEFRPDRILVAFQPWVGSSEKLKTLAAVSPYLSADETAPNPFFDHVSITGQGLREGLTVDAAIASLKQDPRVRIAEPDYIVRALETLPNDPSFPRLWGLRNTGQGSGDGSCTTCSTRGADISAAKAWDLNTGSDSVVVGVIDSGVDYNHPDLTANILRDASNKVIGYDYANKDSDPMDDNGHGTHCSGTIGGAGNNGVGVAGVCWKVKIMPLKFLNSGGSGYTSDAIPCIDYAIAHGAQILSNSWGGGGYSQLLLEAIQRAATAGILFVAAAGNSGSNSDIYPMYPASYNQFTSNVISVAATDYDDNLASFSNYGPNTCDIAAPGVLIYSTYPPNQYVYMNGTSMATPHVAGAAALVKSQFPQATLDILRARILYSADHIPNIEGYTRRGRLNVFRAIQADTMPPGVPTNFSITLGSGTALRLTWTASGEDQLSGTVSGYQVLYNTVPDMTAAKVTEPAFSPGPPGTPETFDLQGLLPDTLYYVGLRAMDKVGNVSPLAYVWGVKTNSVTFYDGAEVTPALSSEYGNWGATSENVHTGKYSYGELTAAPTNSYSSILSTNTYSITGPSFVRFWAKTDLENYNDWFYFQVAESGGSTWWYYVCTGVNSWTSYQISLERHIGKTVKIGYATSRGNSSSPSPSHRAFVDDVHLVQLTKVFEDSVESSPQFNGFPPWNITTEASVSGSHSWSDSPGGNYRNGAKLPLMQNSSVNVSTYGSLWLGYRAKVDLEYGRDHLDVYASGDEGANWEYLGSNTGSNLPWTTYMMRLPAQAKKVRLMFFLSANEAVTRDGVYLDDIGIWGEAFTPVTAPALFAAPRDFDNNGISDLVWRYEGIGPYQGWNTVWLLGTGLSGTGTTGYRMLPAVTDLNCDLVGTADFDGDGVPDILWRYNGTGTYQGWNSIWYMKADGSIKGTKILAAVSDLSAQIAGCWDMDGDGVPDIVWRYYGVGTYQGWNSIWYLNTDGTVKGSKTVTAVPDTNWRIEGGGDFDGDGVSDLLWRYYGTGTYQGWNSIWYMKADGTIKGSKVLAVVPDLDWRICGTGQFDRDGSIDILWRYYGTGTYQGWNSVWFMNPDGSVKGWQALDSVPDVSWVIKN